MKSPLRSTALLTLIASVILPISAWGDVIASGTLTDKSGDSEGEDVVSSTITVDDKSMVTFEAHLKKSTFKPGHSVVGFCLDLDGKPETGFRGVDSSHADSKLMGVDVGIDVPYFTNEYAIMRKWDREGKKMTYGATKYDFKTLADGYSVTIPLADLGTTVPTMKFKVTGSRASSANSGSGVFDYMSDFTAPPGTVALIPIVPKNRIWTDAETGRTLEGILQSKSPDGREVKIKRKDNGSMVTLKPEHLAEADREFIKTWIPE